MSAGDIDTLSDLHWQDPRLIHIAEGGVHAGWGTLEERLRHGFLQGAPDYHLSDMRIEVFHGKFGSASALWERFASGGGRQAAGTVTFVLSRMGSSWKIVADHHASADPAR